MCKILPRIKLIAEHEGITIGALERVIGASKGVLSRAISNGTDIQSKWLQAIVDNYPQYSVRWLISGKGEMLNSKQARFSMESNEADSRAGEQYVPPTFPTGVIEKCSTDYDSTIIMSLISTIKEQAEEIGKLKNLLEIAEREKNELKIASLSNTRTSKEPSPIP